MVNPAFRCVTKSGHQADVRSVVSDSEIDPNHVREDFKGQFDEIKF